MRERLTSIVLLTAMAALGAWLAVMWLDNDPPYVYDAEQSRMFPDPADQQSMVTADWKLKAVKRTCPGTVQRYFRDMKTKKIVATLDTTPVSRVVREGDNTLPRSFMLPPNLPGEVGYSAEICFECNLLQQMPRLAMCVMTPELTFHVKQ